MAAKKLEDPASEQHVVEEEEEEQAVSSSKKRKSTALEEIEVDLTLPEPPSKKARRALKKGKMLPAKPQSSDDEADEKGAEKPATKTDSKKERSPHGVWIGNLRFSVTKVELRKWLVDNAGGAITDEAITRVHMPTSKPAAGSLKTAASENRGFAYVDFSTFEAKVAAIALSETELASRKLLIKDNKSFEGRPKKETVDDTEEGTASRPGTAAAVEGQRKKNSITKIFVGNLSFQVSEDDLRAHFEKCGKIRWIKVATFEDTGKCKGYGWVNFEEPEAAEWAVKGFVKVKETIETLEDFMDETPEPVVTGDGDRVEQANGTAQNGVVVEGKEGAEDEQPGSGSAEKKKRKPAQNPARIKTRKWWVNQLFGRPLKIELAEDDQTRYNKRFRGRGRGGGDGGQHQKHKTTESGPAENAGDKEGSSSKGPAAKETKTRAKKDLNVASDISVARLTGAPVAHQGKKITFD